MLSNLITFLIIGVAFNFIFDTLVSMAGTEEFRLTIKERIIMTLIWPIGVLMFVFYFIRNAIK